MLRKSILNLRCTNQQAPRFCDVIVDGDDVVLEVKTDKDRKVTINFEDLLYQVNVAKTLEHSDTY